MASNTWYKHEMRTAHDMLVTCVGYNFGPNPVERIDEIREQRYRVGKRICTGAGVTSNDVVVDIGSGCGFVTRAACEMAGEVHCVDVSKEFLDFTRDELSCFDNVRFHHIDYGHIDMPDSSADFVYSTAVFIHFYFYDFVFYLIEINRILKPGGRFYVEILDADRLSLTDVKALKKHITDYCQNPGGSRRMLQPFSGTAFRSLSRQLGFEIEKVQDAGDMSCITLRKVESAILPEWLKTVVQKH